MSVYSLHYHSGLTMSLQEEAKDIVQAVSEIKTLTSSLKLVRENVDSYYSRWFETVSKMCNVAGTIPPMPKICGRQCHRASIPASNTSEYSREELSHFQYWTIFFLSLTSGLVHIKNAFQGLYLVPSVLVTEDLATVSSVVMKVGELYAVALPNVSSLSSPIHNRYTKRKSKEKDHGSNLLQPSPQH